MVTANVPNHAARVRNGKENGERGTGQTLAKENAVTHNGKGIAGSHPRRVNGKATAANPPKHASGRVTAGRFGRKRENERGTASANSTARNFAGRNDPMANAKSSAGRRAMNSSFG